jgi:hypothetical protein
MCWSGEASAVLAATGIGASVYVALKGEDKQLYLTLMYFSLMELLQAYTYLYIDDCNKPANQVATLFGYLHIVFQPFFINAISMYFIPREVQQRIQVPVYALCFVAAIFMLVQLYPFDWAGQCTPGRPLCGPQLCSVSGNWHIAWEVPTNGIGNLLYDHHILMIDSGFASYTLAAFFLPLLYGSWRFTLYHYFMGPFAAHLMTDNPNEFPAVWCLLSIGFLLIVVKTPIRKILHVRRWFWWPKAWTS